MECKKHVREVRNARKHKAYHQTREWTRVWKGMFMRFLSVCTHLGHLFRTIFELTLTSSITSCLLGGAHLSFQTLASNSVNVQVFRYRPRDWERIGSAGFCVLSRHDLVLLSNSLPAPPVQGCQEGALQALRYQPEGGRGLRVKVRLTLMPLKNMETKA